MDLEGPVNFHGAMALLQQVVHEFEVGGRRAYSAGLKPALQQRTYHAFSEHRLGFRSFREFLLRAEREGYVRLRPTSNGDLEALSVESANAKPVAERTVAPWLPSIRSDIWKAFNDWTPGWKRLYKITTAEVYLFPEHASPFGDEKPEYGAYRAEAANSPEGFKEISPIAESLQRTWMASYAAQLTDEADRRALEATLETDRPIPAFTRLVIGLPGGGGWKRYRTRKVLDEMYKWASKNGLELEPFATKAPGGAPAGSYSKAGLSTQDSAGPTDEARKRRVLAALERMPLAELLRLSIPVEYLIES